jgi:hypothetical protein
MNNFDQVCRSGCIAEVTHPNPPEPAEDECCQFCGDYTEDCTCDQGVASRTNEDDPSKDR